LALFTLAGCAATSPREVPGGSSVGLASWYGAWHHGRRAASGEVFDMHRLTAAHRSLPFGTRVRVTNLENGRSVVVRVTDRGPYVADRAIDLSREAARALGMLRPGLARVRLELLPETN
jgi:rare lipoprotein A